MMQAHPALPSYSVNCPDHRATFHFGLSWAPLIGSHPARVARQRAAAARASHYICCGERGVAVAWIRLAGRASRGRQFSAASLFAACHPSGAVVWTTTLPDGRHWLVGARDGAVLMRTDRIFDTYAEVQAAVEQMVEVYPGLRVLSAQDGLPAELHGSPQSRPPDIRDKPSDILARLAQRASDRAAMQRLSWLRRIRPGGWLTSLAIPAACALALNQGLPERTPTDRPLSTMQRVSRAEREAQIATAMRSRWSGARSYVKVVSSLRSLPVTLEGWRIVRAHCNWGASAWSCQADYRRVTLDATNQGLLAQVPRGLQVKFTPLSAAHIVWALPDANAPLALCSLSEPSWVDTALVSALQARAPAFTHITLSERAELLVPTPDGIVGPDAPSPPGRRSLTLQGPLRSFGLLGDLDGRVAWVQAALDFQQGMTPGLAQSALQLNLKGWIHEK